MSADSSVCRGQVGETGLNKTSKDSESIHGCPLEARTQWHTDKSKKSLNNQGFFELFWREGHSQNAPQALLLLRRISRKSKVTHKVTHILKSTPPPSIRSILSISRRRWTLLLCNAWILLNFNDLVWHFDQRANLGTWRNASKLQLSGTKPSRFCRDYLQVYCLYFLAALAAKLVCLPVDIRLVAERDANPWHSVLFTNHVRVAVHRHNTSARASCQ